VIAVPNQGIELPLDFKGDAYMPPESKPICTATVLAGTLTVSCNALGETHLISDPVEMTTGHTYKISGQVKGSELSSSKEPNAAGVSLLGEKMLLDFPSGSYDWRNFETSFTVPRNGPRKISVGVGGWKQGKGKLEVKDLKLYK
jgi:hypothetical protein